MDWGSVRDRESEGKVRKKLPWKMKVFKKKHGHNQHCKNKFTLLPLYF